MASKTRACSKSARMAGTPSRKSTKTAKTSSPVHRRGGSAASGSSRRRTVGNRRHTPKAAAPPTAASSRIAHTCSHSSFSPTTARPRARYNNSRVVSLWTQWPSSRKPREMSTILEKIVASKQREIAERRARTPEAELQRRLADAPPVRDFHAALESQPGVAVIAEVKKASPSAGVLRHDFDPVAIARTYAAAGAAAISVLTDAPFFQGELAHLSAVRAAVTTPLLCKDFILEGYQLLEARLAGADAVLL